MKQPIWLTILQTITLAALGAFALIDAATDHGVLMAINCICLGFAVHGMIAARILKRMSVTIYVQSQIIIDMTERIARLVGENFPSIQPGRDDMDRNEQTKH